MGKEEINIPVDVIKTGEYVEPYSFENDSEAVLFYSYIEQIEYINQLKAENEELTIKDNTVQETKN